MRATYEEHRAKVDAIRDYIKVLRSIADLPGQHPEESSAQALKAFVRVPQKRIYDYSLVIITLYGIFESFVEKMMCAYLNALRSQVHTYAALPDSLKKNHIELSTKLLGTNSTKYGEIKPSDIIANLHSCLNQSGDSYQLNVEAFRQHTANFRQDALRDFFNQAGANNIQLYITNDPQLTGFIRTSMGEEESEEGLPVTKYFEMLQDLVERRNVVAHGSEVDDLLSFDLLDQYSEYIALLMSPIYEALLYNFYSILVDTKSVTVLGTPINVFNNSIVCINSANNSIKIGDVIISQNGDGDLDWGSIQSIKIEDACVDEVDPSKAVDIGMAVSFKAKKTFTYFLYPGGNP